MSNLIFILIVLCIGVLLAYFVDRYKSRPGSTPNQPNDRRERFRWMYFWYKGRFPSKQEMEAEGLEEEKSDKEGDDRRKGG